MKTAMQEMYDQLKASKKDGYGLAFSIDMLLENEESMLQKEKEAIMNAYDIGWSDGNKGQDLNDLYYFETFNTNQKNLTDSTNGYTYYPQEHKIIFNTK